MRAIVAQLNPTIGDFEGNTQRILQTIENAKVQKVDIVLFGELSICGYPPEDLLMHATFIDAMERSLERIIQASKGLMVVVGVVRRNTSTGEKPLFNSAAVIADGKLLGFEDKLLLPTYDVFDERRYFEPGEAPRIWEYKGKRIGVIICEDIWQHAGYIVYTNYSRDPILELLPEKPDILLNLSASPYHFQKPSTRVKVVCKAAKTLKCPVLLCCQVGGNDELVFDGYSIFVNGEGNLQQLAKGFEEDEMLVDLDAPCSSTEVNYDPIQDLYKALVLGVRDYFHKSGFTKACLGLSGGIDSAIAACIGKEALGKENILGVAMPSRFSSASSVKDAEVLARNLGIELLNVPIEGPFTSFLELLTPHFQGKAPDVAEENIQARIRGIILMALSNKHGHVVLSTGNKSEMAMGYCTLYGDMAGGLGVIADVTKKQVYELARWINREKEIIPKSTIEKAPSAELRLNQKDSDSLPDYDIIDKVLQGYVEDCLSLEEVSQKYQIPIEIVMDLVQRIHRAEYKRRQSAPAIRVSRKAFRAGRRYPIVQRWI